MIERSEPMKSLREDANSSRPTVRTKLAEWALKYGSHPRSGPLLCLYALVATVIETIPVTFILSLLIAVNRKRWKHLVFYSVLGSAIGSVVLAWMFHRWGYAFIAEYYPGLVNSAEWKAIESWIAQYGMVAIAGFAAIPFPLTPAIALCGLMRMPLTSLFLAVLAGKAIKYSVTALTTRFSVPHFEGLLDINEPTKEIGSL